MERAACRIVPITHLLRPITHRGEADGLSGAHGDVAVLPILGARGLVGHVGIGRSPEPGENHVEPRASRQRGRSGRCQQQGQRQTKAILLRNIWNLLIVVLGNNLPYLCLVTQVKNSCQLLPLTPQHSLLRHRHPPLRVIGFCTLAHPATLPILSHAQAHVYGGNPYLFGRGRYRVLVLNHYHPLSDGKSGEEDSS